MSRQNKQAHKIQMRKQITALHKKGVANSGVRRSLQSGKERLVPGFTTKYTSANKGRCVVLKGKRISLSLTNGVIQDKG